MVNTMLGRARFARRGFGLVLAGLFSLSGCGSSQISGVAVTSGLAHIERVEVIVLESFPVQVQAHIAALLQDSCTTRDTMTQERIDTVFVIRITTIRPTDALCAEVVTPFEERVALEVYGLPAGIYGVDVNGVRETFVLTRNNVLP